MAKVVQRNSMTIVRLFFLLVCCTLTSSCLGNESSDTVCVDGAAAAKQENYERAMSIWAENSVDASVKMKLRAILDCVAASRISENHEQSTNWILARAEDGSVQAMLYVAIMFASGVGVDPDIGVARDWLNKAADGGSEAASFLRDGIEAHIRETHVD